jgi:hypothetical protein
MTEIIERAEVAQILADPRFLVPEADASAATPFDRFRALASRFANGAPHDRRRGRLDELLESIRPAELAELAATRTREALERGADLALVARQVPVATLATALGFSEPDSLPSLVAQVTGRYASGTATDAAAEDSAIEHLLAATPPGADDEAPVLSVQLLVQAHAATAGLVEGAMRRLEASVDPLPSTRELLHATLRDESPVPLTRRTAPDGTLVVLRLDGPDTDAEARGVDPRTLAFGAGPRGCPAPHHALAIAAAIVDEFRRARPVATSAAQPSNTEETFHADPR